MSMTTFQTSKEGIQGTGGAPRLAYPYVGPARLINVENRTVEGANDATYPNVLAFTFELAGKDVKGNDVTNHVTEKLEWEPREDDDAKKVQNKLNRIGYISKYWVGDEKAASFSGNTWKEYIDNVVAAFNALDDYSKKIVRVKVNGQVYNNKPGLDMPNYKGFISDDNSAAPVSFSQREIQDNNKYIAATDAVATSDTDLVEDSGSVQNPFDSAPGF